MRDAADVQQMEALLIRGLRTPFSVGPNIFTRAQTLICARLTVDTILGMVVSRSEDMYKVIPIQKADDHEI